MTLRPLLAAVAAVFLAGGGLLRAEDFVAQLVYVYNQPEPAAPDGRIAADLREKIGKAFGYKHARLAQKATSPLRSLKSDFPPLGPEFSVEIHQLEEKGDHRKLKILFYHQSKCIVETTVDFRKGSPIFIKGPRYDQGLLVLVITVNGAK